MLILMQGVRQSLLPDIGELLKYDDVRVDSAQIFNVFLLIQVVCQQVAGHDANGQTAIGNLRVVRALRSCNIDDMNHQTTEKQQGTNIPPAKQSRTQHEKNQDDILNSKVRQEVEYQMIATQN